MRVAAFTIMTELTIAFANPAGAETAIALATFRSHRRQH
jgi:hypothetical protein